MSLKLEGSSSSKRNTPSRVIRADIYMYSMHDEQMKLRGMRMLKMKQDAGVKNVRVIICGGDGSVMWVI